MGLLDTSAPYRGLLILVPIVGRHLTYFKNKMTSVQISYIKAQQKRAARKAAEKTRDYIHIRKAGGTSIV